MDYKNYDLTSKQLFCKLEKLYDANGYYDIYKYPGKDKVRNLRSPVNRAVSFYVSKLSKEINVTSKNQTVVDAIEQVFKWSNLDSFLPVYIKNLSLLGSLIFKVCTDGSKIWFESVDLKCVNNIKTNKKGFIEEITIIVPMGDWTQVEYWNKQDGFMATWKTQFIGENFTLENMGTPEYTAMLSELGIDFVPFVKVDFKSSGNIYGESCVSSCLDLIDEVNKSASKLNDLLFRYNKPVTTISSGASDKQGRPIPAPKLSDDDKNKLYSDDDGSILSLPGLATVAQLIANLPYADALSILNAGIDELNRNLPEIKYFEIADSTNLSGKAIRLQLSAAIDRAEMAQENFLNGMERIAEISLTLGSFWGIFSNVGTYEQGYDFELDQDELFPIGLDEKASMLKDLAAAGMPLSSAMQLCGFDQTMIDTTMMNKQKESVSPVDQMLTQGL